jgi:opacity protein-like surface antigen
MKKTFLLIAALLMMGSAAFAGGGFDLAIGPKVGYQTASLSYQKADIKDGFSNHFTAGLFGRVTVGRVYVQPEVLYFKTSNIFDVNVTGTDINENLFNLPTGAEANLTLNSMNLQVPIMIGFNVIDLDVVTLRAQVGPTANFTLKSRTVADYKVSIDGQPDQDMQQEVAGNDDFDPKTISWGVQAGIGIDVLKRITLDINYNFGLSKMFDALNETTLGETFDFSNIDNTRQNMFMVTVGIKLL